LDLLSPETKVAVKIQAIPNPNLLPVQDAYPTQVILSENLPKDSGTASISEVDSDDDDTGTPPGTPPSDSSTPSLTTDTSSDTSTHSTDNPKTDSDTDKGAPFSQKLKEKVKKMFPKMFRKTVGYPPAGSRVHHIDTGNAQPFKIRGRPHSPRENLKIKKFVEDALEKEVIEPSDSLWSLPLLLIPKKNGTLGPCVDLRALNNLTRKNAYPLPRIDECYLYLKNATIFTTLDLKCGYWQVRIADEDRCKTAFTCRFGHFQVRVMAFGLTGAPATFQEMMNDILQRYIDEFVMVYLDDIVIYSSTLKDTKLTLNRSSLLWQMRIWS
jgi:hypothetical protein